VEGISLAAGFSVERIDPLSASEKVFDFKDD